MERLMDFLSEFLAVEKGGAELYQEAAERSSDPELRGIYERFLRQTQRHAILLSDAIVRLGGDPGFLSPGAEIQVQRVQSMLDLEVPPELRELQDAENLLLAETKDHADWEFLDAICSRIPDVLGRAVIRRIVDEVEDEEDEHLKFAQDAVAKLARIRVMGGKSSKKRAA